MKKFLLLLVILTSFLISAWLWKKTYYINPWPTDSWHIYIPAAKNLHNLNFVSEIFDNNEHLSLYNKQVLILGVAAFQYLLNDINSLFPNIALLIVCFFFSTILIYQIFTRFFNSKTGLLGAFLFVTSFWSYLYILLGAHQPLVLVNLLFAVYCLTAVRTKLIQYLFSGLFVGLMMFSSPTAPLFFIYYLAALCYVLFIRRHSFSFKHIDSAVLLILAGILFILIPITMPDPWKNIKHYFDFVEHTRHYNDFVKPQFYFSHYFVQYSERGAGVSWIFKYFLTTMPVYFIFYVFSVLYLFIRGFRTPSLWLIIMIGLSTPICVEISQSAQFGRNYFSWHIGMIFTICAAFYHCTKNISYRFPIRYLRLIHLLFLIFLVNNTLMNTNTLLKDVIPSRLFTNDIYSWLILHSDQPISIYQKNPFNVNAGEKRINNPKYITKISFNKFQTIKDVSDGYILIPPVSGKNIYMNCQGLDFKEDPYLNELLASGRFQEFVVAEFPTIGSSDIWNQEEEYCTYVDLHLGKISALDKLKSRAYILDAEKLHREWFSKGYGNFEAPIIPLVEQP